MKIELSKEELNLLIASLDAVTRGGGLEAAKQVMPLANKLQDLVK